MRKILVAGGSGYLGLALIGRLKSQNKVIVLSRKKRSDIPNCSFVVWDGCSTIVPLIEEVDVVINLCGENVGAKRWSDKRKQILIDSRITSTRFLVESIKLARRKPSCFLQASACGFYGNGSNVVDETSNIGRGFLADLCGFWEQTAQLDPDLGVRQLIIRTGIVLSANAAVLKKMKPSKLNCALVPNGGKQYWPWIHLEDHVAAIDFLIENNRCTGVFNLVAPETCTVSNFLDRVAAPKAMFKIAIPRWFLKIVLGAEMVDNIVLADQKVSPSRLLANGFVFRYPTINDAIF